MEYQSFIIYREEIAHVFVAHILRYFSYVRHILAYARTFDSRFGRVCKELPLADLLVIAAYTIFH